MVDGSKQLKLPLQVATLKGVRIPEWLVEKGEEFV